MIDWKPVLRNWGERRGKEAWDASRKWTDDPHEKGLIGEVTVAVLGGSQPDTRNLPGGDRGVDQEWMSTITGKFAWQKIDAKCATFPKELWVGVDGRDQCKPDCIYILVGYQYPLKDKREDCGLALGWEWGHEMMKCPTKDKHGTKDLRRTLYYKEAGLLRPISDLMSYYCKRWRWHDDPTAPERGHPAQYEAPVDQRGLVGFDNEGRFRPLLSLRPVGIVRRRSLFAPG